jgi:hypothetical protein
MTNRVLSRSIWQLALSLLTVLALFFVLGTQNIAHAAAAAPGTTAATRHVGAPGRSGHPNTPPPSAPPTSAPASPPTSPPFDPAAAGFSFQIWISALALFAIALLLAVAYRSAKAYSETERDLEAARIVYGFWLIVACLVLILGVVALTINILKPAQTITPADTLAVITSVTGVVGTLIAAFFGVQAAAAGRSQALSTLDKLQSQGQETGAESKLDPSYGPHAGNTRISVAGNGFTGASGINFGTIPGTNFQFVNDGVVRATAPAAPAGKDSVDVAVIYKGATPVNQSVGTFYYYTITPNGDMTSVEIRGGGLKNASQVCFGTAPPQDVSVDANGYLTVTIPERPKDVPAGTEVDVIVVYPVSGATGKCTVGKFKWPDEPTITSGSVPGNQKQVTLNGTGFGPYTTVTIKDNTPQVQFVDAGTLQLTLDPVPQPGQQLTIVVRNPAYGGENQEIVNVV